VTNGGDSEGGGEVLAVINDGRDERPWQLGLSGVEAAMARRCDSACRRRLPIRRKKKAYWAFVLPRVEAASRHRWQLKLQS
jgi:hypothetical protein